MAHGLRATDRVDESAVIEARTDRLPETATGDQETASRALPRAASRATAGRPGAAPRDRAAADATLYFDLASPHTYLAAERADRAFEQLRWVPAFSAVLRDRSSTASDDARAAVIARARRLRLPLILPLCAPVPCDRAMRVASLASERGCAAAFVLAATRLIFCGTFDIEKPLILAEAAAFAGISLSDMLSAASDARRDAPIAAVGRALVRAGADALPAIRIAGTLFCGEHRLAKAVAARARR
ncbi:MAG TPA: hypothetical protein VHZ31_05300 [Solirubrobacteraceae bacterium]|jgi:2-hydroxychromene-2-carboxylate isomerase|nr:hypothetical protein [Solirubrobacteraceae bacterium]